MSETHQWDVQIVTAGEVLGAIHLSTEYYTGPFDAGTNQIVCDLRLENVGTEDGNIYFQLFEYPGDPTLEQIIDEDYMFCAYTANYCDYGPIMITIPTGITSYPLGIKVRGEDESWPVWGSMGTFIWGKPRMQPEMYIIA